MANHAMRSGIPVRVLATFKDYPKPKYLQAHFLKDSNTILNR
jgi:hypothetical protein